MSAARWCAPPPKRASRPPSMSRTHSPAADVFPLALAYLRIYLIGMPVILLYNLETYIMDVWLFEYEGEVDLGNATMDEVAQVAWMNREQIKELFDANMFVDTLEYFFTEDDRQ